MEQTEQPMEQAEGQQQVEPVQMQQQRIDSTNSLQRKQIQIDTKVPEIQKGIYIYEIIKEGPVHSHYIGMEITNNQQQDQQEQVLYVKQSKYKSLQEHNYALQYYQDLQDYQQLPVQNNDMVQIGGIFQKIIEEENYYELIIIYECGQKDAIDTENIDDEVGVKFIKNILNILLDLHKHKELYHGNLSLKNIVICNGDVMISGFKPIYVGPESEYNSWKKELVLNFGYEKLDIFCLGLIWLQFLKYKKNEIYTNESQLNEITEKINQILEEIKDNKAFSLIKYFFDLQDNQINIENLILKFEEFFILEKINDQNNNCFIKPLEQQTENSNNPSQTSATFPDNEQIQKQEKNSQENQIRMSENRLSFQQINNSKTYPNEENNQEQQQEQQAQQQDFQSSLLQQEQQRISQSEDPSKQRQSKGYIQSRTSQMNQQGNNSQPRQSAQQTRQSMQQQQRQSQAQQQQRQSQAQQQRQSQAQQRLSQQQQRQSQQQDQQYPKQLTFQNDDQNNKEQQIEQQIEQQDVPEQIEQQNEQQMEEQQPEQDQQNDIQKLILGEKIKKKSLFSENPMNNNQVLTKLGSKESDALKIQSNSNINQSAGLQQTSEQQQQPLEGSQSISQNQRRTFSGLNPETLDKLIEQKKQKEKQQNELLNENQDDYEIMKERTKDQIRKTLPDNLTEAQREEMAEKIFIKFEQQQQQNEANSIKQQSKQENESKQQEQSQNVSSNQQRQTKKQSKVVLINEYQEKQKQIKENIQRKTDFIKNELENKLLNFKKRKNEESEAQKILNSKKFQQKLLRTNDVQKDQLFYYNDSQKSYNISFQKFQKAFQKHFDKSEKSEKKEKQKQLPESNIINNKYNEQKILQIEPEGAELLEKNIDQVPLLQQIPFNENIQQQNIQNAFQQINQQKQEEIDISILPFNLKIENMNEELIRTTLFYQQNLQNLPPNKLNETQIQFKINLYNLLIAQNYKEAVDQINDQILQAAGDLKIELYKLLSRVFFIAQKYSKAKQVLLVLTQYIKSEVNIKNKELQLLWIIYNISFIDFQQQKYQDCINDLQTFFSRKYHQIALWKINMLIDANIMLKQYTEAIDLIKEWFGLQKLELNLDFNSQIKMLNNINKLLYCLKENNDQVMYISLYKFLQQCFTDWEFILNQNNIAQRPILVLRGCLLLRYLRFSNENEIHGLTNFLFENALQNKLLENFELDETKRFILSQYLLTVCLYLKSKKEYGGFKQNYIQFLNYAQQLFKECTITKSNIKLYILILFNKSLYYIQECKFKQLQDQLELCFAMAKKYLDIPNEQIIDIAFKIGKAIINEKKWDIASSFYGKLIELYQNLSSKNEENKLTEQKIMAKYLKCLLWDSKYNEAIQFINNYLISLIAQREEKNEDQLKLQFKLCSILLCNCLQSDPSAFNDVLNKIRHQFLRTNNQHVMLYEDFYSFLLENLNDKQKMVIVEKYTNQIFDVFDQEKENKKIIEKIYYCLSTIYKEFTNQYFYTDNDYLLNILCLQTNSQYEKVHYGQMFLVNFCFILVNGFKWLTISKNLTQRYSVYKKLAELIKSEEFETYLNNKCEEIKNARYDPYRRTYIVNYNLNQSKIKMANQKLNKNQEKSETQSKSKKEEMTNTIQSKITQKLKEEIEREKKINQPEDCVCQIQEEEQYINDFIKQLKSMFLLEVYQDIEQYFNSMIYTFKQKNYSMNKLNIFQQLINFHLKNVNQFNRKEFLQLLVDLFKHNVLCTHIISQIIKLLESFKNLEYVQILTLFIHNYYPEKAFKIFHDCYLGNFEQRYLYMVKKLADQVYKKHNYTLELFTLTIFGNISHKFNYRTFEDEAKLYLRPRHEILADPNFLPIFENYLDHLSLYKFIIQYNAFKMIVKLSKAQQLSHNEILKEYLYSITCGVLYPNGQITLQQIYNFILICHLIDFKRNIGIEIVMFEILQFLKNSVGKYLDFHTARCLNHIGSLLLINDINIKAKECQKQALNSIIELKQDANQYPPYIPPIKAEELMYNIISQIAITQIQNCQFDEAQICITKLNQRQFNNKLYSVELLCLQCYLNIEMNKLRDAEELIKIIDLKIEQEISNNFDKSLLDVISKKLQVRLQKNVDPKKMETKEALHRQSLAKLNSLIEEYEK